MTVACCILFCFACSFLLLASIFCTCTWKYSKCDSGSFIFFCVCWFEIFCIYTDAFVFQLKVTISAWQLSLSSKCIIRFDTNIPTLNANKHIDDHSLRLSIQNFQNLLLRIFEQIAHLKQWLYYIKISSNICLFLTNVICCNVFCIKY